MCTIGTIINLLSQLKNTKGGIYLVRDPRDVLISYSNHMGFCDYETNILKFMSSSSPL